MTEAGRESTKRIVQLALMKKLIKSPRKWAVSSNEKSRQQILQEQPMAECTSAYHCKGHFGLLTFRILSYFFVNFSKTDILKWVSKISKITEKSLPSVFFAPKWL